MSDRKRLVRIDAAGTITLVRDLEDGSNYQSVQGSFKVTPSNRKTSWSPSQRRYGGATAVSESHDNGTIAWSVLIKAASADLALANASANLFADVETARNDLYLEWRPEGASNSTYYEVRGPASYAVNYQWVQFLGAKSFTVDVTLPVAPLCLGAPQTIPWTATTMPAVIQLSSAVLGDPGAPALCYLSLTTTGGAAAPVFALIGWQKRPTITPLAGAAVPFGVIEAESAGTIGGWTVQSDATYRGGSGLKGTASGAGNAFANFTVDPNVLQADDFARGEIDLEVWGRFSIPATLVSPIMFLTAFAGITTTTSQFSADYGTAGQPVIKPASGSAFRFMRLGVVTAPVDTLTPNTFFLSAFMAWAAGSSGTVGMDYIVVVPARQRALSSTGKPLDSTYAKFIPSTNATTKTIRPDLSGRRLESGSNPSPDSGLGGVPLELPSGNVDILVKLSSLVPGDPTSDTTTEQLSHSVSGSALIYPRYFLARSS